MVCRCVGIIWSIGGSIRTHVLCRIFLHLVMPSFVSSINSANFSSAFSLVFLTNEERSIIFHTSFHNAVRAFLNRATQIFEVSTPLSQLKFDSSFQMLRKLL